MRMPFGSKPVCSLCEITFSVMWRKNDKGQLVCNSCSVRPPTSSRRGSCPFNLRKSTRAKSYRKNAKNQNTTKGKGRRSLFKKTPQKARSFNASITTTDNLFYKGQYFQVGDIVYLRGSDKQLYFAQIYGLAIDDYGGKCAYLSWLVPTADTPEDHVDLSTYILGEEDPLPRKIEYLTLLSHAPADFFKKRASLYDAFHFNRESGYVWANVKTKFDYEPSKPAGQTKPPEKEVDDVQPCTSASCSSSA